MTIRFVRISALLKSRRFCLAGSDCTYSEVKGVSMLRGGRYAYSYHVPGVTSLIIGLKRLAPQQGGRSENKAPQLADCASTADLTTFHKKVSGFLRAGVFVGGPILYTETKQRAIVLTVGRYRVTPIGCLIPGTWYKTAGRPGGVSGYPRAWYRSVS